jgi:adenine-specific DNA-methyltransferase
MIKDIEKNNENVAINDKEIAVLKEHFPACFKKDGSFDIERFKEQLKDKVDVVHEGYELKFLGKSYAKLLASVDTTTVITPNTAHNDLPENTNSENIYISGDNLDGLKHLLKSYAKSVKCIYIDPPYNTGSDGFVYKDNFNFTANELQEKLSLDETQANRILELTKKGASSHSAWLLFMYSRLQLAKDLLKDDGVIFISIDDNELANLKLLCDDVFGEENWLGTIIWKNATDNNPTQIAIEHEYVLAIAKSKGMLASEWKSKVSDIKELLIKKGNELINKYSDIETLKTEYTKWFRSHKNELWPLDRYKHIDIDGIYTGSQSVHNPGKEGYRYDVIHPVTKKPCKQPLMGYRFPQSSMKDLLGKGKILYGKDETKIIELKLYAKEYSAKLSSVIDFDGRIGAYDLRELFPHDKIFTNPKPFKLINQIISFILNKEGDIILDFFSGSASTAHAVMQLNAKDNGLRKFISIQLPEILDLKNSTQKLAFDFLKSIKLPTTLDYVGYERIKRAAKNTKEETNATIDYGFKHYILNEPNPATLDKCESFDKASLLGDGSILEDFGIETVLTTWFNYDGYGLTTKAMAIDLNGYEGYYYQKHLYLINTDFMQESLVALFEKYDSEAAFNPENIILFGYSFNEWSVTEMLEKNLKILNDSEKNLKINIEVRY